MLRTKLLTDKRQASKFMETVKITKTEIHCSFIMNFQAQYKFASQYPSNFSVVWVQNSHNTSQLLISNQFTCWVPYFSHMILAFIMQVTDEPETLNLTINNFKRLLWQ